MTHQPFPRDFPAAPSAGVPAPLLDRFVARLLDAVVVGVPYLMLSVVVNIVIDNWFLQGALTTVLLVAMQLAYFGYLESAQGQTLGKRVMKLRTVGPRGTNPTLEQALRRNLFYAAGMLSLVPFVGGFIASLLQLTAWITIALGIQGDPVSRQAWHDRLAGGTQVLKYG